MRNAGRITAGLLGMVFLASVWTGAAAREGALGSGGETEKRTLKVAMECARPPYNWSQASEEDGAVQIAHSTEYVNGFDVTVAKKLCEELGLELEIYKFDWDSLVPAVVSGSVDCAIAGQTVFDAQKTFIDYTQPYYRASVAVVVKSDSEYAQASGLSALAGAACTSQAGTFWYQDCLPQIKDGEIKKAQDTTFAMLELLEGDKCDLVVTDLPVAEAACAQYSDLCILDFGSSQDNFAGSEEEICISVAKGNEELLAQLNSVLEKLDETSLENMMEESMSLWPVSEPETKQE